MLDDPVTGYAKQVVSGDILAGPHVRDSCKRHLRDLEEQEKRGIYWDLDAALHVIKYFKDVLRLNGGEFEGVPFELLEWQKFIIGSLFGWKSSDGYRRFRVAFIESGKGSGKSPLSAGVGLYMLTADGESRAEVYAAAKKKDQAKVLFRDAVAMVEQSPALNDRLVMGGGTEKNNIAYLAKGSFFRPISSEDRGKGQSGPRPHCALLDEIHEHSTNAMVEFMRAGTKGRRQALIFMITNSGSDRESVCYDYHDYGAKVAAGELEDDSFFSYICALDENDDPFKDPECWGKANPSLGITFTDKYLEEQVRQAKGMPSKQNIVLRLNFCRWTDSDSAWIGRQAWEAIEHNLDIEDYYGQKAYGGLDLSAKLDLTAKAIVFPQEDGSYHAFLDFWKPKDTLMEREEKDRVPYSAWARDGYLHTTPGKSVNYSFVAKFIGDEISNINYETIAYDRWRIEDLRRELDEEGVDVELSEFGQGFKDMAPAIDFLEELILNEKLKVNANPILKWNVASAVIEEDAAGNRKFSKRRATGRIDGLIALTQALAVSMNKEETEKESVYASRGVRVL